jgi:catechol 2,3-dioxygenase-like lactoylglutathione lyase family enzyme
MLEHLSIGVKDMARSKAFYDAALKPLGGKLISDYGDFVGYGIDAPKLWVMKAEKPVKPEMKNGLHLCLSAPTRKAVDAFHAAALKAGGADNGKPGVRTDYSPNYYAAFVIDPDGYRLEAVCFK